MRLLRKTTWASPAFAAAAVLVCLAHWLVEAELAPPDAEDRRRPTVAGLGAWGMIGGMRAAVANACWLLSYRAWERRDGAATACLIELAVAADERPVYFWLNGARILASDLPEWEIAGSCASEVVCSRIRRDAARRSLVFLRRSLRWHPHEPAIYIEMATLQLHRLHDVEAAARLFRIAAKQPRAPRYAARIHAELLRSMGLNREALVWLREILPTLPADDPDARRDAVVAKIAELERECALLGLGGDPGREAK